VLLGLGLGLGLAACALVPLARFLAPAPLSPPAPKKAPPATGLLALDELPPGTYHRLLERRPTPIGREVKEGQTWRWDEGRQLLDVKGTRTLLFPVGTTHRHNFDLEVGVAQAPWTGGVGVFWGYREDAALKSTKAPGKKFARFQMLAIDSRPGPPPGWPVYTVRRYQVALTHNTLGEVITNPHCRRTHVVPGPRGEKVLAICVRRKQLLRASFGGIDLTNLCAHEINKLFAADPYDGALGVISLGHTATFTNLRFIGHTESP
jgi:hypothetical protein